MILASLSDFIFLALIIGISMLLGVFSIALMARNNGWFIATGKWSQASGSTFIRTRWYGFRIFGWHPIVRVGLRYWVRSPEYRIRLSKELRGFELPDEKNLELDTSYRQGLHNGFEAALALIEKREPDFYSQSSQFLLDEELKKHQ